MKFSIAGSKDREVKVPDDVLALCLSHSQSAADDPKGGVPVVDLTINEPAIEAADDDESMHTQSLESLISQPQGASTVMFPGNAGEGTDSDSDMSGASARSADSRSQRGRRVKPRAKSKAAGSNNSHPPTEVTFASVPSSVVAEVWGRWPFPGRWTHYPSAG